ncbi:response regulator [Pseudomaricurvus alkylphenolicus]|uniref:tetratricopeptide repeat-containing response regulator n=1 Tax=Pseudomaricurvus alkylphenolicus TaxID=1306991 RepID=UPI0014200CAF|nr:tetratricopeptide repeat-containing response regulator [Pseudomaricurvus alkylphenolicus]NIB43227.1 response regulator [Pseudomaricurvus alkylphenolicus]
MTIRQIDAIKIYQRKKCLIIDDMSEIRGGLKRMLNTFGVAEVHTAANSELAIDMCDKTEYDMVLCDYNLGEGQDGQQVLEELRYRKLLKNSSLFLMITAETSRDMVLGALEYLPDDYLTKPITQTLLQTRLNRIVIRHEDLLPIKEAIDREDYRGAIGECQAKLDAGGKYTGNYMRIQAELLFRLEHYEEAQEIYEDSLKRSNPVWAQLGLGKTYLAQKRFKEAEAALKEVVKADHRFVEAHDLLAECYASQADFTRAQRSMEDAATVSPKSVLRQRRLANMAKQNEDTATSLQARRAALKVGEHSCYYSPQDYFDIVSELLDDHGEEQNLETRVNNAKEAEMYLRRAERKHPNDKNLKLQRTAAQSRLANYQKKSDQADMLLEKAKKMHDDGTEEAFAELELAQAMAARGDKAGAAALIQKVAREHPDNEEIADRADILSEEPVSKKGKKMAADLTRKGIKLYEDKEYDEAIDVFNRAIGLFPNHIGLRLNIAQVALTKAKLIGPTSDLQRTTTDNLEAISDIDGGNAQYARYQHLMKQAGQIFP